MKASCAILALALSFLAGSVSGQGTFQNLNFESAVIKANPGGPYGANDVFANPAITNWTAYVYGNQVNDILYDSVTFGAAAVSIHDTNDTFGLLPIAGSYSVFLQGQSGSPGSTNDTAAIGQIGQIPTNAESLSFIGDVTSLQITFNGTLISIATIGSSGSYSIYAGDISSFAGQTGELRFTAPLNGSGFFDNIQFSPTPIPEPTALALMAVGGLLLGFRRARKSSS